MPRWEVDYFCLNQIMVWPPITYMYRLWQEFTIHCCIHSFKQNTFQCEIFFKPKINIIPLHYAVIFFFETFIEIVSSGSAWFPYMSPQCFTKLFRYSTQEHFISCTCPIFSAGHIYEMIYPTLTQVFITRRCILLNICRAWFLDCHIYSLSPFIIRLLGTPTYQHGSR